MLGLAGATFLTFLAALGKIIGGVPAKKFNKSDYFTSQKSQLQLCQK